MCKGGKFTNLYIGTGMKRCDPCFNPTLPPLVDTEPSEPVEQMEPTPFNEPVVAAEPVADPVDDEDA